MKNIRFINLLFTSLLILSAFASYSQDTLVLQPNAEEGKDAYIHDLDPNVNLGDHPDFAGIAWTCSENLCIARNLIEFDLTEIPQYAPILSAKLTLYYNPTTPNNGHFGENESLLQRITSPWDEFTVTWNNQPYRTTLHQVTLPQSISSTQDYPDVDVTEMVQDMIDDPQNSFGFMLKLHTEEYYRSMIFASSDNTNSALHPKLVIVYVDNTGIEEQNINNGLVKIFPIPFSEKAKIELKNQNFLIHKAILTDIKGQVMRTIQNIDSRSFELHKDNLEKGIYFFKLYLSDGTQIIKKLIII